MRKGNWSGHKLVERVSERGVMKESREKDGVDFGVHTVKDCRLFYFSE